MFFHHSTKIIDQLSRNEKKSSLFKEESASRKKITYKNNTASSFEAFFIHRLRTISNFICPFVTP